MKKTEKYKHIRLANFPGKWSATQTAWDENLGSFVLLESDTDKAAPKLVFQVDDGGGLVFITRTHADLDSAINSFFYQKKNLPDADVSCEIAAVEAVFENLINRLDRLVGALPGAALVRNKTSAAYEEYLGAVLRMEDAT